jgi:hypothetical protein
MSVVVGSGDADASSTMTVELGTGTITTARGSTIRSDGRLAGQGTLGGDLYNAGTLAPGGSTGTLVVDGDYMQDAAGTLLVELGGITPGTEHDRLEISGTAALGGSLRVELLPGLAPMAGSTFRILTAQEILGDFDQVDWPAFPMDQPLLWEIGYTATDVILSIVDRPAPGDFSRDGVLDVADIDLLSAEVRAGSHDVEFDLNNDRLVDSQDRRVWVNDLRKSHFGDSNLDGEFNSSDLVAVFQAGQYEDSTVGNATWATGDWNGDGDFDSADFVTAFQEGGYERGPRQAIHAVPEPSGVCVLSSVACVFALMRRKRNLFWTSQTSAGVILVP